MFEALTEGNSEQCPDHCLGKRGMAGDPALSPPPLDLLLRSSILRTVESETKRDLNTVHNLSKLCVLVLGHRGRSSNGITTSAQRFVVAG